VSHSLEQEAFAVFYPDGEDQQQLQQGGHVEYRWTWDYEGGTVTSPSSNPTGWMARGVTTSYAAKGKWNTTGRKTIECTVEAKVVNEGYTGEIVSDTDSRAVYIYDVFVSSAEGWFTVPCGSQPVYCEASGNVFPAPPTDHYQLGVRFGSWAGELYGNMEPDFMYTYPEPDSDGEWTTDTAQFAYTAGGMPFGEGKATAKYRIGWGGEMAIYEKWFDVMYR